MIDEHQNETFQKISYMNDVLIKKNVVMFSEHYNFEWHSNHITGRKFVLNFEKPLKKNYIQIWLNI